MILFVVVALLGASVGLIVPARAQAPPTSVEVAGYLGLHAAVAGGVSDEVGRIVHSGADLNARDGNGRTPLHVAAFFGRAEAVQQLIKAGADPSLLDGQRYDAVTISAVRDDLQTLQALLANGASARLITSPYDGTALIAAAHLGHTEVVRALMAAGAPLDHVNNLGWTALMEAVVLGDGGGRHTEVVRALLEAGARTDIPDRHGVTPSEHARRRGYAHLATSIESYR